MSQQRIDITTLEPQQVFEFKQQLQSELQHLSQSLQALSTAKLKFQECSNNVKTVSQSSEGENLLVPLTASMYVPGQSVECQTFLVDVGTGYFIEKNAQAAMKFYQDRCEKLIKDSEQLNKIVAEKLDMVKRVDVVLKSKLQSVEQAEKN